MSKSATQAHAEHTEEAVAEAEAAQAAKKAPREPKRGIGTVANEQLKLGKTNAEVLAAIKAEFPDANTTMASVNWYRNNLRTSGEDVPTARSLAQADREAAKAQRKAAKDAEKAEKKAARDAAKAAKKTTTTLADAEAGEGAFLA